GKTKSLVRTNKVNVDICISNRPNNLLIRAMLTMLLTQLKNWTHSEEMLKKKEVRLFTSLQPAINSTTVYVCLQKKHDRSWIRANLMLFVLKHLPMKTSS